MPNKPVRQSAKFKEQQYRKRMAAQAQTDGLTTTAELDATDAGDAPMDTPEAKTVRFAPVGTGAAAAAMPRPGVAPRRPSAVPLSAVRSERGRIAAQMQERNLQEEMIHNRGDIQRLLILAGVCLVILIALSFVVN
jgi:hypothetical protein